MQVSGLTGPGWQNCGNCGSFLTLEAMGWVRVSGTGAVGLRGGASLAPKQQLVLPASLQGPLLRPAVLPQRALQYTQGLFVAAIVTVTLTPLGVL